VLQKCSLHRGVKAPLFKNKINYMPISAGPNPALDSNIIFSYDVGDTINSYIGEPTTNLLTYSTNFSAGPWYSYCGNNSNVTPNTTEVVDPFGGFNATKVVRNNQTICDGSTPGWGLIYSAGTLVSGNTYTNSIWARSQTGNISMVLGISDFYTTTVTLTENWQRFTITVPYNAPGQNDRVLQFYSTTQNVTYYVCAAQTEPKDHATQYVASGATNGVRSVTQGLLPLISNIIIDLSNVSFTSNAQIVYDGTDDHIDLGNLGTIGTTYSIECVFNSSNVVNYRNLFDMNYATYPGVTGNVGPRLEQYSDGTITVIWSGVTNNNSIAVNTPVTPISANTNYHMVFTQDGNKGSIYLNGAYKSQNSNTYGYPQTFGDANLGRGFSLAGDRYFVGTLPLFKIYNQALSSDQVKQNYNQYKSRFNLS